MNITGKNVSIINGKVFVNGREVTDPSHDDKVINVVINGDVENIEADYCTKIEIHGNAGVIHTTSGDVNITGNVSGSVKIVSGNVKCGNIDGSVKTVSGDIKFRKQLFVG